MTKVLLQVNFDIDPAIAEKSADAVQRAHAVAELPGLIWKVWLRDRQSGRGGGIYLFEDRASAEAWGKGRFETMAARMPWSSKVTYEYFDVEEDLSRITRAFGA